MKVLVSDHITLQVRESLVKNGSQRCVWDRVGLPMSRHGAGARRCADWRDHKGQWSPRRGSSFLERDCARKAK